MKGSLAAILRVLTLPFGATSGRRIVLDGVGGEVDVYGQTGALVARIDNHGMVVSSDLTNMVSANFAQLNTNDTPAQVPSLQLQPGQTTGPTTNWTAGYVRTTQIGFNSAASQSLEIRSPKGAGQAFSSTAIIRAICDSLDATAASMVRFEAVRTYFTRNGGSDGVYVTPGAAGAGGKIEMVTSNALEVWKLIAPLNTWTNVASNVQFAYRKVPSPADTVEVIGLLQAGNRNDGIVLGNLPVGYRPVNTQWFPVSINVTPPVGGHSPHVTVDAAGDIKVFGVNAATMSFLGLGTLSIKTDR